MTNVRPIQLDNQPELGPKPVGKTIPATATCQEITGEFQGRDVCCRQRAVAIVEFRGRTEGPYFMCVPHADHSVRNRGAALVAVTAEYSIGGDGNLYQAPVPVVPPVPPAELPGSPEQLVVISLQPHGAKDKPPDYKSVIAEAEQVNFLIRKRRRMELAAQIEVLEEERKELDAQIKAEVALTGHQSIECEGRITVVVSAGRESLDREKLLEQGVTIQQIKAATSKGAPYSFLRFGEEKAEQNKGRKGKPR